MIYKTLCSVVFSVLFFNCLTAQQGHTGTDLENQANVLFGLGQIVQRGYNIEGNLFYKRFVFDYSHGVSLDIENDRLEDGADKDQDLDVHIPWTTGFGLGYRFNDWLNLRAEPKWHKFELYYSEDVQNDESRIADYTTFTLGLGLYANFKPFKNKTNFLRGIMIAPNVRWWPNISNSIDGDEFTYQNRNSGEQEIHEARNIGIGNTPFIVNVSIGYSFDF